ncbi:MAG: helix-turn-helix transcriptional regulator [Bacteroidota bacterium]
MNSIGENIRKHYSQAYVAEELGTSQNAYSKIEANQTKSFTIERLEQLAALFEVSVVDLLGITPAISINTNYGTGYVQENQGDLTGYVQGNHDYYFQESKTIELLREELQAMRKERAELLEIIKKMSDKLKD